MNETSQTEQRDFTDMKYFVDLLDSPVTELTGNETIYPWSSFGSASDPLGETTIGKTKQGAIELMKSYQSKWQTVFGLLTGGILSAIFASSFTRHKTEQIQPDDILEIVRFDCPHPSDTHMKDDPPERQITYQLKSKSSEGGIHVHVFRLTASRGKNREQYERAQEYIDGLVRSVAPQAVTIQEVHA